MSSTYEQAARAWVKEYNARTGDNITVAEVSIVPTGEGRYLVDVIRNGEWYLTDVLRQDKFAELYITEILLADFVRASIKEAQSKDLNPSSLHMSQKTFDRLTKEGFSEFGIQVYIQDDLGDDIHLGVNVEIDRTVIQIATVRGR